MGFPINDTKTGPEHFADVAELVRKFVADVSEPISEQDEVYGNGDITEIEHRSYDGFIAYTNGGLESCLPADMSMAYSAGDWPVDLQVYIDQDLDSVKNQWNEDNPDHQYDAIFAPTLEEQGQQNAFGPVTSNKWRETYWDFESEWMREGGTYFYKIRAIYYAADNSRNETGEREIYFMAGLCLDFEYGRDKGTIWKYDRTVKAADLTPELIDEMVKDALEAF